MLNQLIQSEQAAWKKILTIELEGHLQYSSVIVGVGSTEHSPIHFTKQHYLNRASCSQ